MSEETLTEARATEAPAKIEQVMDINRIMSILPHRYPFLLIDRVLEIERKKRIVAIKNVTINEPYFQGHFPGYPIMPGVLIVEAIAQTGGLLILTEIPDPETTLMVFTGIDGARFRRPVIPGDQVRIEVTTINWRSRAVKMLGSGHRRRQARLRGHRHLRPHSPPRHLPHAPTHRGSHPLMSQASIHPTAIIAAGAQIPAPAPSAPTAPSALTSSSAKTAYSSPTSSSKAT